MPPLDPLDRLVAVLARLPSIGRRSAERMAMRLVRDRGALARDLSTALLEAADQLGVCTRCGGLTPATDNPCRLCSDARRDGTKLCVVEDAADILVLERSAGYRGRYHVLQGKLSPMRGQGIRDLRIDSLLKRIRDEGLQEVILALNTDVESDATARYLHDVLAGVGVQVTRLAYGLPAGSGLAYSDPETLSRAVKGRTQV